MVSTYMGIQGQIALPSSHSGNFNPFKITTLTDSRNLWNLQDSVQFTGNY